MKKLGNEELCDVQREKPVRACMKTPVRGPRPRSSQCLALEGDNQQAAVTRPRMKLWLR